MSDNQTIPSTIFHSTLVPGNVKGAMKSAEAKSRDLWQVPIANIRILPEFNVRIRDAAYLAHLRSIVNSIKQEGFYQHKPLEGYVANEAGQNVIYLTGGHTRFEATGIANQEGCEIHTLPIIVSPPGTSAEDLVVALVKGNEGKPLTPFETGIVCKRLVNFGWETKKIAQRLNMTETYVDGLLLLVGAPAEIRDLVQSGQVSATTAIQTLRTQGSEAIRHLQDGVKRASEAGASRVTAKHLPGQAFKKAVTKSAPVIYGTLKEIVSDPGYGHISETLRSKLDDLLANIKAIEDAALAQQGGESSSEAENAAPAL